MAMSLTAKKFVTVALILITITAIFSLCYITYIYWGLFEATRSMDVSVLDVKFTVNNSTSAIAKVYLKILNPSEFTFLLFRAQIYLKLDGTPMACEFTSNNVVISPFSNVTLSEIQLPISGSWRVSLITSDEKILNLDILFYLDGPHVFKNMRVDFSKELSME